MRKTTTLTTVQRRQTAAAADDESAGEVEDSKDLDQDPAALPPTSSETAADGEK